MGVIWRGRGGLWGLVSDMLPRWWGAADWSSEIKASEPTGLNCWVYYDLELAGHVTCRRQRLLLITSSASSLISRRCATSQRPAGGAHLMFGSPYWSGELPCKLPTLPHCRVGEGATSDLHAAGVWLTCSDRSDSSSAVLDVWRVQVRPKLAAQFCRSFGPNPETFKLRLRFIFFSWFWFRMWSVPARFGFWSNCNWNDFCIFLSGFSELSSLLNSRI